MRFIYNLWLALLGTLGLNFLACMLMLIAGIPNGAADMGVALGYCFTITAASFLLWYRPLYNAFMKEMSMYYCKWSPFCFFLTFLPFLFYCLVNAKHSLHGRIFFSPLYYYLSYNTCGHPSSSQGLGISFVSHIGGFMAEEPGRLIHHKGR